MLHWGRKWKRNPKTVKELNKKKEKLIQRINTNKNSCWCLRCLTLLSWRCKLWIIFSPAPVWPWGIHNRFPDATQMTQGSNARFIAGKTHAIRWCITFKWKSGFSSSVAAHKSVFFFVDFWRAWSEAFEHIKHVFDVQMISGKLCAKTSQQWTPSTNTQTK